MSSNNWILILSSYGIGKSVVERVNETKASITMSPNSSGRKMLEKHLSGEFLTRREAILARCAECSCYYVDGRKDCEVYTCPLYQFMPYGKLRKRYIRKDRRVEK